MLTVSVVGSGSFAWVGGQINKVAMDMANGSLLTQYFHQGTGTAEDPFVITRPVHYYNLVNLYQRVNDYSDKQYHFQVGLNNFNPEDTTGYYVYEYDDDGNPVVNADGSYRYVRELNLASYDDENPLLPIGTHDKNFRGYFDGKGITISGFTVSGDRTQVGSTDLCDIGIFGYVGGTAEIANVYFENVTIDLTNVDNVISSVTSPQTHNEQPHYVDGFAVAYAGYLAGHIVQPNNISKVYLNNVTITGGGSAIDNFGYYGCVENEDGTTVPTLGQSIGTQFGSGDENGWGGTVDMKQLYNRLYKIADKAYKAGTVSYPSKETVVMEDGKLVSRVVDEYSTDVKSHSGYSLQYRVYRSDVAGSYYFNTANDYEPWIYLTGLNEYQTKTVTSYTITEDKTKSAYYISDEDAKNYMGITASKTITNQTSQNTASKWNFEASDKTNSRIYVLIGTTMYYLNRSGNNLILGSDASSATLWTYAIDEEKNPVIFSTEGTGEDIVKYYITFNEVWQVTTTDTTFTISDRDGHYLSTDGTAITNETDQGRATAWIKAESEDGKTIKFKVKSGTGYKYLAFVNGEGLTLSENEFTWNKNVEETQSVSNNGLVEFMSFSYKDADDRTWYVGYDGGWKALVLGGVGISCTISTGKSSPSEATYNMSANADKDGVTSESSSPYMSHWQMDKDATSSGISFVYNGKEYYLSATTDGKVILVDSDAEGAEQTIWYKDENSSDPNYYYYMLHEGTRYYLTYSNGWAVKANTQYNVYYQEETVKHYMAADFSSQEGAIVSSDTLRGEYTTWQVDDLNKASKISVFIDGVYYYLCCENKNLVLKTKKDPQRDETTGQIIPGTGWDPETQATIWEVNTYGGQVRRYTVVDGDNLYIGYDNGKWSLVKVYSTYQSNSKYLTMGTDTVSTGVYNTIGSDDYSSTSSQWEVLDGKVWTARNNKKYYLTCNGENQEATAVADTPYVWKIENNVLKSADGKLSLVYQDGIWITVRSGSKLISNKNKTMFLSVKKTVAGDVVIGETINSAAATAHWIFDEVTSGGSTKYIFSIVYGGKTYYVGNTGNNDELSVTEDRTKAIEWTSTTDGYCYYPDNLATPFYLLYDGGFKLRPTKYHYIQNKTSKDYLNRTYSSGQIGFENSSSKPNSTGRFHCTSRLTTTDIYFYEPGNGTYEGGKSYYLGWDGSKLIGTPISTASSKIQWKYDSNGYYITANKYLMFDTTNFNGWTCLPVSGFYTISDNGKYLGLDQYYNISLTQKTRWTFENSSAKTGKVSAYVKGVTYYLNNNNGSLAITTSGNTSWSYDSTYKTLVSTLNGYTYYLTYDANASMSAGTGWKLVKSRVKISATDSASKTQYLVINSGNIGKSTSATTFWNYDENAKKLSAYSGSSTYYLNYSTSTDKLVLSSSGTTTWECDSANKAYYFTSGTMRYYLVFDDTDSKAVQGWVCKPIKTYSIYSSTGSNYLGITVGQTASISNTNTRWTFTGSQYAPGTIYTYTNGNTYYLNVTDGKPSTSTTDGGITWKYNQSLAAYYYSTANEDRYLVYDSTDSAAVAGWVLRPIPTYSVKYESTYFGAPSNPTSSSVPSTTQTKWHFTTAGSSTTKPSGVMSTCINGVMYYVHVQNGRPIVNSTKDGATSWNVDSNGYYYNDGSNNLYMMYDSNDGGWIMSPASWHNIVNIIGSTTYRLGIENGAFVNKATKWIMQNNSGAYTFYTYINGEKNYLVNNSGTLGYSTSKTTSWYVGETVGSNVAFYSNDGNGDYYLTYTTSNQMWVNGQTGWQLLTLKYLISDKSSGTNYYIKKGISSTTYKDNGLPATTDINNAARFTVKYPGSKPHGKMSTSDVAQGNEALYLSVDYTSKYTGTYYFLAGENSGRLYDWQNKSGSRMFFENEFDTGWKERHAYCDTSKNAWFIRTNANENIVYTPNINGGTIQESSIGTTTVVADSSNNAVTTESSIASAKYEASAYNITVAESNNDSATILDAETESGLTNKTVVSSNTIEIGGVLTERSTCNPAKYVRAETTSSPINLTDIPQEIPEEVLSVRTNRHAIRTVQTTGQTVSDPTTKTNQRSGYATYIPLRLAVQDPDDKTSYYDDYRVDSKNTGYIVSGGNQTEGGYRSDIRVSNYDTSDIYRALGIRSGSAPSYSSTYDSKLQVVTKTYKSNGQYVRIQDSHNKNNMSSYNSGLPSTYMKWQDLGLTKYESDSPGVSLTRDAFANMLMGSNDVFGLHFMEALIPNIYGTETEEELAKKREHIVYADKATVLHNEYTNYELPEDAINFYVNERGAINFFAGTYYSSSVTSFFSLHHVERDSNKHITTIKEIKKVYQKANGGYIYKYGDGSYSETGVTDATIGNYTMVFDLSWITNPSPIVQNALYYFEIPVNRGEYCLGSVDGGIGAYLLYLDIATNGGGATEERISSEGSGIHTSLMVDYRSSNQVKVENEPSLLLFAVEVPESGKDDFSINTTFYDTDNADADIVISSEYENGVYLISVDNQTGKDIGLVAFVCDNDSDKTNNYPYAYKIRYKNNSYSTWQTLTINGVSYFKTCYEYLIPATGDAS